MSKPAPRGNRVLMFGAAALAVVGVGQLTHAHSPSGPPQPTTAVIGDLPPNAAAAAPNTAALADLPYALPTHIDIPAVNLHAAIISVGLASDGTIGTPPLSNAKVAGWYDRSPSPGQRGASVIDAHVDSALMKDYRGAFYYLGLVKPGMQVEITRADHTTAVFTIDEVQVVLKTSFPTSKVYTPTPYSALRLITCGGDYDSKTHEYLGNTIVYAHLTATRTT
jgi:sortase (surface protein transpeptidase)